MERLMELVVLVPIDNFLLLKGETAALTEALISLTTIYCYQLVLLFVTANVWTTFVSYVWSLN